MEEKLKRLRELLAEVANLHAASALLNWDQQVYMPEGLPRIVENRLLHSRNWLT
jgi:Zn-dependent M32 family carboxypeptidase